MSGPIVVATLDKNQRERVRVALDEHMGHRLIDLRVCVPLTAHDGTYTPSKKGVSLNVRLIPTLRVALSLAEAEAIKMGWLDPSGEEQPEGGAHEA